MKGKRVYPVPQTKLGDFPILQLNPGEYGKDSRTGFWFACPPGFSDSHLVANLSNHTVTEHDDETITVEPSIQVTNTLATWHGFLEKGIWREA